MVKQSAIDLPTVTRSYARTGYFDPIANRTNLNLLTGRVNELLLDSNKRVTGIRMQERGSTGDEGVIEVKADVETILCAGALHSPQVLQRSGIGPPSILNGAGIDVLVDLPGVGSNFQDHPDVLIEFNCTKLIFPPSAMCRLPLVRLNLLPVTRNVEPNPLTASYNETFASWAEQQWAEHRSGKLARLFCGRPLSLTVVKQALIPKQQEIQQRCFHLNQ